ncbi:hypothetical protein FJY94_02460 [Candidatus Kaiserbacteria bacterium]|nr:hypothetical protein [Candidatus Kaiserbacteria bacterium]
MMRPDGTVHMSDDEKFCRESLWCQARVSALLLVAMGIAAFILGFALPVPSSRLAHEASPMIVLHEAAE